MSERPAPDATTRFSDRVDDYTRYRPAYPASAVDFLVEAFALGPDALVADIGAGTGIFTGQLLGSGRHVVAVEPNAPMRAAADARLGHHGRYRGVAGSAEATGLDDASVDLATAAQAFHWFDPVATRAELDRVLKPDGGIALIWNRRDEEGSAFAADYEAMLRELVPEYRDVGHRRLTDERLDAFLGGGTRRARFANAQSFDREGLRGRLLSSSYCPRPGSAGHEAVMARLDALFTAHREGGRVTFDYVTEVYASGEPRP